MKKSLILLTLVLCTLAALAQRPTLQGSNGNPDRISNFELSLLYPSMEKSPYQYRLDSYFADDDYEIHNYFYDAQGRCIAIENIDGYEGFNGSTHSFDSLRYDANNNMIRLDCYQYMSTEEGWRHVNYCLYTYDEQHRLATRTNYNIFNGEPNLGGVYTFEYDDQGRLALRWLQFMGMRYDEMHYTYDDQGRLQQTLFKLCEYPSPELYDYERCDYTYGSNGLLASIEAYNLSSDNMTRELFTYNADGDMTDYLKTTASGTELEKRIYSFGSLPMSDTYIPRNFEQEEPLSYSNHHAYDRMQWYTQNDNMVLTYVCDFIYEYDQVNGHSGYTGDPASIDQASAATLSLYPNPATDRLTIEGQQGDNMLYLYSLDGRLCHMQRLSGADATVDLSALARGTYLVRVNGTTPRTATIVVK